MTMIIENILEQVPSLYFYTVLGVSIIMLIVLVLEIITIRLKILTEKTDISRIESAIRMHQDCNIENLPLINDVFEDAPGKISRSFNEMIQVSKDLYQKKWIPSPKDFLTLSAILDSKTYSKLTGFGHRYYMIVGFVLFVGLNVFGSFVVKANDDFRPVFLLSLIPLVIIFILSALSGLENKKLKFDLTKSIDSLNHSLSLHLPVFSENNGMSILINQFLEYDRNMADSVGSLTDKIDRFVLRDLSEAVSESIEKTLLESVAPSIERANNAIITLSQDISRRETEGIKELAVNFASALTSEFTYQFEPMVESIKDVSNTLSNSKNFLDIVSQTLESYRINLNKLHELTSENLRQFDETKSLFSEDMHTLTNAVSSFEKLNNSYNEKIHTDMQSLEKTVSTLNKSSDESAKMLRTLLDGIFVEARNTEEQALKSQENSEKYLDEMRSNIGILTSDLSRKNKEFIDSVSGIINNFTESNANEVSKQQGMLAERFENLLLSIENSASSINRSSQQLKNGFDELEAARIRLEEERAKKSFFRRNK